MFYDAPSSPIGERPFFPDNPVSLRSVSKMKSYIKEDAPKNMKDFVMTFEISEVAQLTLCNSIVVLLFSPTISLLTPVFLVCVLACVFVCSSLCSCVACLETRR